MSKPPGKSLSPSGSRILPTSVSQVGTITKYELVNYFKSRRFFILLAIGLIISGIFIGKWLGALTASLMVLAIYAAITVGNGLYYFGANVPYQFAESLSFSILYLIAVLGFTFFFSSLFKSSSMSILVTAILFLFAFSLIQLIVSGLVQV